MESGFDMEAATGEAADIARKDKSRLAVTRPAESHLVDVDRLRFGLIVIGSGRVSTVINRGEARNGRQQTGI